MRMFGVTLPVVLMLAIAFVIGAKNPGWLSRVPLLNRI